MHYHCCHTLVLLLFFDRVPYIVVETRTWVVLEVRMRDVCGTLVDQNGSAVLEVDICTS